jgi:hypothetical protein
LQVDWEGGAVEEDAPGWTITATGAGLCFTPAAKLGICLVVTGLATEIFDDEILWGYRRSAKFTCIQSGDTWEVKMMEQKRIETFVTNDSEWFTKFDSTSAAPASAIASNRELVTGDISSSNDLVTGDISSSGTVAAAHVALVALPAACLVLLV